jgi:DnaJ-class molecular chaperone
VRTLLAILVVLSGCVASRPDDASITAHLACETARLAIVMREKPAAPSDRCENCDGTGKIGDGRIVMTCPVCKGTGKKAKSVLKCKDGTCPK